ncbi:hypothetical protein EDD15DRAFT_2211782 [Pisolithus albus]|nr:hypothetical protein EDD15DRAFT_2211782 [Pisolithus albus]
MPLTMLSNAFGPWLFPLVVRCFLISLRDYAYHLSSKRLHLPTKRFRGSSILGRRSDHLGRESLPRACSTTWMSDALRLCFIFFSP